MTTHTSCVRALGLALCALCGQQAAGQSIVIRNVTVIDVAAGAPVRDQTVVIESDRIRAIGPSASVAVARGARVVEGRGKYLMPGMWDMHTHFSLGGRSALTMLVVNGVLGVRDMGGGFDVLRAWRDSITAGTMVGPRIELVGPIVENRAWLDRVLARMRQDGNEVVARSLSERIAVSTPEDAQGAVQRVAALGVSMLKVRNDPPPPAYFALLRAARERNIRVVGHPPNRTSLGDASDSGHASIEHLLLTFAQGGWGSTLDVLPPEGRAALLSKLARNRTALVPTIVAGIGFRHTPDSVVLAIIDDPTGAREPRRRYVSDEMAAEWRGQIRMKALEGPQPDWAALNRQASAHLRAIDSAGVPVLLGTDMGAPLVFPGFAVHDELALMVRDGGMSPARALHAATLAPAQFLGLERELGTVAAGKRAELVLLDADPLADIANVSRINSVIRSGRLLDRTALDALMKGVATSR